MFTHPPPVGWGGRGGRTHFCNLTDMQQPTHMEISVMWKFPAEIQQKGADMQNMMK